MQLAGNKAKITKMKLGWIIPGKIGNETIQNNLKQFSLLIDSLHRQVSQFWEIKEIDEQRFLSEEESQVESFYNGTIRRKSIIGKYIVRLPFNEKKSISGDSYQVTKRRFESIKRKLVQNPEMKNEYNNFMREYIELGICLKLQKVQKLKATLCLIMR